MCKFPEKKGYTNSCVIFVWFKLCSTVHSKASFASAINKNMDHSEINGEILHLIEWWANKTGYVIIAEHRSNRSSRTKIYVSSNHSFSFNPVEIIINGCAGWVSNCSQVSCYLSNLSTMCNVEETRKCTIYYNYNKKA
jgi:hypothetical protein